MHQLDNNMAQSPPNSRRKEEPADMTVREWSLKARMVSRENTRSRRFSSSYITSFREDSRSFRTNITISSTASSPGYNLKEDIDPSTYSFSSALRALQARSVNTWECLSPEGFALNSKWNEAEKYICNPFSGEVPLECLSAKTLRGSSFRNLTNKITMSAPLIYPSHSRFIQTKPCFSPTAYHDDEAHFHNVIKDKKVSNKMTRDVGVQSKMPDLITSTPLPSTPPLTENSEKSTKTRRGGGGNSLNATHKLESDEDVKAQGEMQETRRNEENERIMKIETTEEKQVHRCYHSIWKCRGSGNIGCLSLRSLWMTRKSDKSKNKSHKKNRKKKNIFPLPC